MVDYVGWLFLILKIAIAIPVLRVVAFGMMLVFGYHFKKKPEMNEMIA